MGVLDPATVAARAAETAAVALLVYDVVVDETGPDDFRLVWANPAAAAMMPPDAVEVGRCTSTVDATYTTVILDPAVAGFATEPTVTYTVENVDGRAAVPNPGVWEMTVTGCCDGRVLVTVADRSDGWRELVRLASFADLYRAVADAVPLDLVVAEVDGDDAIAQHISYKSPQLDPLEVGQRLSDAGYDATRRVLRRHTATGGAVTRGEAPLNRALPDILDTYVTRVDDRRVLIAYTPKTEPGTAPELKQVLDAVAAAVPPTAMVLHPHLGDDGSVVDLEVVWSPTVPAGTRLGGRDDAAEWLAAANTPSPRGRLVATGGYLVHLPGPEPSDRLPADQHDAVFAAALDALADGVIVYQPVFDDTGEMVDLHRVYANPAATRMRRSGTPLGEGPVGSPFHKVMLLGPARLAWAGYPYEAEAANVLDPDMVPTFFRVQAVRSGDLLVGVMTDLSAVAEQRSALIAAEERSRSTIDALSDAVTRFRPLVDETGVLLDLEIVSENPAALRLNLASADRPRTGGRVLDVFPVPGPRIVALAQRALDEGRAAVRVDNRDGALPGMAPVVADLEMFAVAGEVVGVAYDRTAAVAQAELDEYTASHVAATGALNDPGLTRWLTARPDGSSFAVVWVRLAELDPVRATLGAAAADRVAAELVGRARTVDGVAVVAQPDPATLAVVVDPVDSSAVAVEAAERLVAELARPVVVDGAAIPAGPHAGLVLAPLHGRDPAVLRTRAAAAALDAQTTRERLRRWTPDIPTGQGGRLDMLSDLVRLLDSSDGDGDEAVGRLQLAYAPQQAASTREVVGAEVLVSWQHPDLGRLSPSQFQPLLTSTQLLRPFTVAVLRAALDEWVRVGDRAGGRVLSVPVPAGALAGSGFADEVADAFVAAGATPEQVRLLLASAAPVEQLDEVAGVVEELAGFGGTVALDDFGSGTSGFAHLRRLPVAEVRIDRMFTRKVAVDPVNRALVEATVTAARAVGAVVCATGVETDADRDVLVGLGCDTIQGYLVGRPVPAVGFAALTGR